MDFSNPFCKQYEFWQLAGLAWRRKALGPYSAQCTQRWVSAMRAMRRVAMAGGKPSLGDYPSFGHKSSYDFVHKRASDHANRAFKRGETHRAIWRRGLFGPR